MIYIGCHITNNIDDRYFGSGIYLKRTIEKHGKEFFSKEILFQCQNEQEMFEKEKDIVNEAFVERLDTYNLTVGGKGSFYYYANKNGLNKKAANRIKIDEEYKKWFSEKVSIGVKKYLKENGGSHWTGKRHSEESKQKIGKANAINQQGEKNSCYGTCWIYSEELKENKKIKKEELETYILSGWIKGRKMKQLGE